MRSRLIRWWLTFAEIVGSAIEETAFRVELAFYVLAGKLPMETEKRQWNYSAESPTLLNVYDWTDDRLICSVLVWPRLETPAMHQLDAVYKHRERVGEVKRVITRGAAELAWATKIETDHGLTWDPDRQVWTATDGFAYAPPERVAEGGIGDG